MLQGDCVWVGVVRVWGVCVYVCACYVPDAVVWGCVRRVAW